MISLFNRITRQLDPNNEGGAGGTNMPLKDIWGNETGNGGVPNPNEEAERIAAEKKAAETAIDPKVQEVETTELTTLLTKDTHTDVEKTRLEALKAKYNVEEVDADGKPLSAEAKAGLVRTEARLKEIKTKPEASRTLDEINFLKENTPTPARSVYEIVDEQTGDPIQIDYKGTDPLSPEGVIMREEAIRDMAMDAYDAELKEKFPSAYRLLTHLQAGGKEEDFYEASNGDFSSIALTKGDEALNESIYRQALQIKGNSPSQIEALVTIAKDKGKLFDEAKAELTVLQTKQKQEETRKEQEIVKAEQVKQQNINGFLDNLQKNVKEGIKGVAIPLAEQRAFAEYFASNIFYQNGKLVYTKIIDPNNLPDELAANYFRFKKGDLSKIVAAKAADLNAGKIKSKVNYKITPRATTVNSSKILPLSEV